MQSMLTVLQTTVLGLIAVYIAWRQWQTANDKLVLDLFEKRYALYIKAHDVIKPIMQSGRAEDKNVFEFDKFMNEAVFLFGDDVETYLLELRKSVIQLAFHCSMLGDNGNTENQDHIKGKFDEFNKVMNFYDHFPKLCRPYMKLGYRGDNEITLARSILWNAVARVRAGRVADTIRARDGRRAVRQSDQDAAPSAL